MKIRIIRASKAVCYSFLEQDIVLESCLSKQSLILIQPIISVLDESGLFVFSFYNKTARIKS